MSYFDHVRCHACKAMLDLESLATVPGQGLTCPKCKAALSLTDLFGLADAFAEEEEGPVSLDDLVSARPAKPPPPRAPAPAARRPAAPAPKPAAAAKAAPPKAATAAPKGSTSLVRRAPEDEHEAEPEPKSAALDAMRALKKKGRR